MANYFLDRTNKYGDLTGTWTFTNASAAVQSVSANGNAQAELSAGDYVKPNGTDEWYYVTSITDDDNFTLAYNFVQTTQSEVTTNYADVSVNDGSDTSKAFVHINQYTTDNVRSAGDVLYCRRGQTHLQEAVATSADENGTLTSPIKIIADDGTNWAGEGGYDKPMWDYNGSTLGRFNLGSRQYWWLEQLKLHDSHSTTGSTGMLLLQNGYRIWIIGCDIDESSANWGGIFVYNATGTYIENCAFTNTTQAALVLYTYDHVIVKDCTFDGNGSGVGFYCNTPVLHIFEECIFGAVTPNTNADIVIPSGNRASISTFRGCEFHSTTMISGRDYLMYHSSMKFYDTDVKDYNKIIAGEGTMTKETSTVRSGGASTSIKVEPTEKCDDHSQYPLVAYETWVYCTDTLTTITLYMLAGGTWSALPDNTEVYIEAAYYDQTLDAGRATVVSNDAFADETNWKAYDVQFTPAAAGMVRLRVYCKKYESGKYFYIDPIPVVT